MEQPVHSSQFLSPWKAPVPELQTWPEHLCVPRHLARDPGSQIPHQGLSKARGSAVHTHTQAQPDRDVSAHPRPWDAPADPARGQACPHPAHSLPRWRQ